MTQPEALRLAEMIERYNAGVHSQAICEDYLKAAAELRRLHEVNQELLGELKTILDYHTTSKPWHAKDGDMSVWIKSARNAINKATGESK